MVVQGTWTVCALSKGQVLFSLASLCLEGVAQGFQIFPLFKRTWKPGILHIASSKYWQPTKNISKCHAGQTESISELPVCILMSASLLQFIGVITSWPQVLPLGWWQPEAWRPSLLSLWLVFFSSQGPFSGEALE